MTILVLSWIAVVVVVVGLVTRPWKTPAARATLPLVLTVLMAAWVLGIGALAYSNLMKDGAWTAATIAIGFVPGKAIVYALLGYALGRTFMMALTRQGTQVQRWGTPAVLALVCVYFVASDVIRIRDVDQERIAADEKLSPDAVAALAERVRNGTASDGERAAFLGNALCPPDIIEKYIASPDSGLRLAVARNQTLSTAQADLLAHDPHADVRFYIAFHPKLSTDALVKLSTDPEENVRNMMAQKARLPDDAFNRLIDDPSPRVRATVARQARLSDEGWKRLLADPDEQVREAANIWVAK